MFLVYFFYFSILSLSVVSRYIKSIQSYFAITIKWMNEKKNKRLVITTHTAVQSDRQSRF